MTHFSQQRDSQWTVALNNSHAGSDDVLWKITRRILPMCVVLPLLGTGLSYIAYARDVASTNVPWMIGALVSALSLILPVLIALRYRHTNALKAYGAIMLVGVAAVYFFFGVAGYFFYFGFAPMPFPVRLAGIGGGLALTVYWFVITFKAVLHTVTDTGFTGQSFRETGSSVTFKVQSSMLLFDKLHKERSPFPRVYNWLVMGISPFCLVLNRLLSPTFGGGGVLFIIAVLSMPLSLWLSSLIVRFYLLMVVLPKDLERRYGKPVIAVE
jgi:hypothetical protein